MMYSTLHKVKMDGIKMLILLLVSASYVGCQDSDSNASNYPLESIEKLKFINAQGEIVEHHGKTGLKVFTPGQVSLQDNDATLVLLQDVEFRDGVIELEIAGEPVPGTGSGARGFVGVAFRVNSENHEQYECIYLRPLNGRASKQLQRNHSVQYVSHPEYTWYKLRNETPGVYESYVDLLPGAWTNVRIEVSGHTAMLYVNGADQPTLMVNDLKRGDSKGGVALWLHSSTIAHYRNLVITPELAD